MSIIGVVTRLIAVFTLTYVSPTWDIKYGFWAMYRWFTR